MLLVTFHGGKGGETNVYAYDTPSGDLNVHHALQNAPLTDAELRGMVYANSFLYVVNGSKHASNIMCFEPPAPGAKKYHFNYKDQFVGPTMTQGQFANGIGHPYALQFFSSGGGSSCYISNQDTNVVAQATVASNFLTASLQQGCQSSYLNGLTGLCPPSGCVYLDGTFVASQNGTLPAVGVAATNVPPANGGLSVAFTPDGTKVQNSVRDVAISGAVLLVCDEPNRLIRLYSLPDGTYLGAGPALKAGPTHLAIFSSGLFVSASDQLYWSALSNPPTPSGLSFVSVLSAPAGDKVGGIAFDTATNTAYVAFQKGTGTTGSGKIHRYDLGPAPASPPVFGAGKEFAKITTDTPEFLLFLP
jgi:hypothetical protein